MRESTGDTKARCGENPAPFAQTLCADAPGLAQMASSAVLWGVSIAGTATSILQNASGLPMLRRVREEGDAARFTRVPLLTMTVTTLQIGLYGILLYGYPDGLQLVFGNVVGLCTWGLQFAALLFYSHGARAKTLLAAQYALALAWGVALPLGVFLAAPAATPMATRQTIVAVFMQAANISGFLSPVAALREALRDRDLRRTPAALSCVNLANSALWTAYGFLLGDPWIAVPNALGLAIAGAQVAVLLFIVRWRKLNPEQAAALAAARVAREEAEGKAALGAKVAASSAVGNANGGAAAGSLPLPGADADTTSSAARPEKAAEQAAAPLPLSPAAGRPSALVPPLGAAAPLLLALVVLTLPRPSDGATSYPVDLAAAGAEFRGVGAQSTAGSARLLIDYPAAQRDAVLDMLFLPQHGASLHHLKVEIGGDAQISCGAEASGQRSASGPADWAVGYEGWLFAEAKRRNPDIELLGLVYAWPAWVNSNGSSPFESPAAEANAAAYVSGWVRGMRDVYNVSVDWVGLWNEREYTSSYVLTLRATLDASGFGETRIVGSDRFWEPFATDFLNSSALRSAAAALSQHYPNCGADGRGSQCPGQVSRSAVEDNEQLGAPLFSTEDYSCWGDDDSAVHWASKLNSNYIGGNVTFFSVWHLISAFYPSVAFFNDGLLRAAQPWGGRFEVAPSLWATAHVTQFTQRRGWRYLRQGRGSGTLAGGGTFVSLVDALGNYTLVIEAAGAGGLGSWSSDNCNAVDGLNYAPAAAAQNATFVLSAVGSVPRVLELWRSRFQRGNRTNSSLFERQPDVAVGADGVVSLLVEPDTVYTLSTLPGAAKGSPVAPAPALFPLPYEDDFESLAPGRPGRFLSDMHGGFQIALRSGGGGGGGGGGAGGQVLRQSAPANACCNFIQSLGGPLAVSIIGAATWRDIEASVDVALPDAGFAFVGVRGQFARGFFGGGLATPAGVFLVVSATECLLVLDVATLCGTAPAKCDEWAPCAAPSCVAQGSLPPMPANATRRLTVGALGGAVWALVDGIALPGAANVSLPASAAAAAGAGFVALGGSFSAIDFDNLTIMATAPAPATPAEGFVLRGLPCGDPASDAGARWTLSPGGGAPQSSFILAANESLCLAAGADGASAVLAACDASARGQAWAVRLQPSAGVVNIASGLCLGAAAGAFPGALRVASLVPCASALERLYWSPDTGYLHTPAQDPLQMVCLGAWAPPPPPPPPPPPQAAAFAAAGQGIAVPAGGASATWAGGASSCNHVALLSGASLPSFWLQDASDAEFVDVGFCTPDINLDIAGPADWMGYAAGKAWVYRASGAYRTAAPPPGQGVPYGAAFGRGDFVTAVRHSGSQIEFLLNGASQGNISLPPPGIPADVVGCAGVCYLGGSGGGGGGGGGGAALRAAIEEEGE